MMIARGNSFSGHERHCVFLNTGDERFADISAAAKLDFLDDGRAVAETDWDHDGDIDFWIANRTAPRLRLLRNDVSTDSRSLMLLLQGTLCNRDAIGARVAVQLASGEGSRRAIATVRAGNGFLTQSTKWLHFGVNPEERVVAVQVRWPGNDTWETVSGVTPGDRSLIVQGFGEARRHGALRHGLTLTPGPLETLPSSDQTRVVFSEPVTMPPLSFEGVDSHQTTFSVHEGARATLLNIWASWCRPCIKELQEFANHRQAIDDAGVRIVSISVDGVESVSAAGRESERTKAREIADAIGTGADWGFATDDFLSAVSALKSRLLYKERPLPVPSSLLLDQKGQLIALYTGPITVSRLLADVRLADATSDQLDAEAFPAPGQFVFRSSGVNTLAIVDAYLEAGYLEDAQQELVDVVSRWDTVEEPSLSEPARKARSEVYGRLAKVESRLGNEEKAVEAWQHGLRFDPASTSLRLGLASSLGREARYAEVARELEQVIKLAPDRPDTYVAVGALWLQLERHSEAVLAFQKGVDIDPSGSIPRFALASALRESGDTAAAVEQYQVLLQAEDKAWVARAANNLAWIKATDSNAQFRNGAEAVRLAVMACQLTKNQNPKYVGTLAAAYAEAGQFKQAIAASARAMKLDAADDVLVQSLQERAKLYRAGSPYHATD